MIVTCVCSKPDILPLNFKYFPLMTFVLFQKMNNAINSVSSLKKVLCKKTVFKKKQSDVNTDDY